MTTSEIQGRPRRHGRNQRTNPRPRTMSPAVLRRWHRQMHSPPESAPSHCRPATRGECRHGLRPCPYVGCRHHLYLEVKPTGALTLSWPHLQPWEVPESCALDVAERDSHTLDEIGEVLNLSWERIRKIEAQALIRLRKEHGETLVPFHGPGRRVAQNEETEAPPKPAAESGPILADLGGC
jgi:Sigma-70, region 4